MPGIFMKRTAPLCIALASLLSSPLFAQIHLRPGVFAGPSMFKEEARSGDFTIETDVRTGAVAGAALEFTVLNTLSFEPGLAYSMRGGRINMTIRDTLITGADEYAYLSIPVHAKLKMPSAIVRPYVIAGPNIGLLISARAVTETGSSPGETDLADSMNTVDWGLDLGAGVEFSLFKLFPYVEFSYYIGMTNTNRNASPDESLTSYGMEVKAGVKFEM
jgi:hypothetical protein